MNDGKQLVEYRISRSEVALKMAKMAALAEEWNLVANRLYYSAYYMLSAYFASIKINVKTHNGNRIKFHELFVRRHMVSSAYGELYDLLFNNRQEADYADFSVLKKEDIFPLIDE